MGFDSLPSWLTHSGVTPPHLRVISRGYVVLAKLAFDMPALKWTLAAIMSAVYYVLPTEALQGAAISAFALIVLDTVTGFSAAWTQKRISSSRFSHVLSKLLAYSSVLIVCRIVTDQIPGMGQLGVASVGVALTLIVCTEAVSVLENIRMLGIKLPFGLEDTILKRLSTITDKPQDEAQPPPSALDGH